ncbi:MAG TPA: Wzz/FepE/Etk N-terminal domain-containing protein [Candidatus Bathyarchaeia archaeon]
MKSSELSVHEYFDRVMSLWWLVLICTILGGVLGYVFFHLKHPIYEATATFNVTIDLNRFPYHDLPEAIFQYNEDMAVNSTDRALTSQEVLGQLITQLNALGINTNAYDLLQASTIERKHDIWELRYRNPDPLTAQVVANTWANIGYQTMIDWQNTGKTPNYVVFQPPNSALLPQDPVLYKQNNLILAGALIGFLAGIILSNMIGRRSKKSVEQA